MDGWHHRSDGHELEQILGDREAQGSLRAVSVVSQRVALNCGTEQQHEEQTQTRLADEVTREPEAQPRLRPPGAHPASVGSCTSLGPAGSCLVQAPASSRLPPGPLDRTPAGHPQPGHVSHDVQSILTGNVGDPYTLLCLLQTRLPPGSFPQSSSLPSYVGAGTNRPC